MVTARHDKAMKDRATKQRMNPWVWKTWQERPYLTCELIPQPHGFFTSHFYPHTPEDLVEVIAPSAQVYRVKQVHSADVMTPDEIKNAIAAGLPTLPDGSLAPFPLADGAISTQPQQSVWACSADCTPALICDIMTGQVAAVHAGWRGTAQKILPIAVSRLLADGSDPKNLRIALGPAIDGQVYQVGKDVAMAVGITVASHLSEAGLADAELIEQLSSVENPPILNDEHPEKVRLDVRRINLMQLEQMGLDAQQIAIAPHCTYQDPDNFFSYRRTHEKKVQWAGIVSH
ncbi:MAG: peptidoglycan editing factor PgeF [Cyanobacteria bacterium J06581_3]